LSDVLATCRVFSAREGELVEAQDGQLNLDAERSWHVEGNPDALDTIVQALPSGSWTRIGGVLVLEFGNAVGDLDLPHLGRIRLRSGKWGEAHFESMLADITERSAALPFAAGTETALPYDRSLARLDSVLLHAFVYLRHALSRDAPRGHQLLPALRAVVADPHRRFDRARKWTDLASASRVDSRTLHGMLTGAVPLERWEGRPVPPVAARLGGRLPRQVNEPFSPSTVDVPENRFVKAFLGQVEAVLSGIESLAMGRPALRARLCAQVREMRVALHPVTSHSLWADVGAMHRFPAESTVLQRRQGYREVLRHFVRLRHSSRLADKKTWRRQLEVKDIATLYELWCFYEVLRCLEDILGPPAEAGVPAANDLQENLAYDTRVAWRNGVELFYNHRFSRSKSNRRRSYSLPMRPDIALWVPDQGYHLLDAKFKVRFIAKVDDDLEEESQEAQNGGKFKRVDLDKMHAYRDAIPAALSAWVLYPGTETQRFSVIGGDSESESSWEGVGAMHCVPGSDVGLSELLRMLLGRQSGNGGSQR